MAKPKNNLQPDIKIIKTKKERKSLLKFLGIKK